MELFTPGCHGRVTSAHTCARPVPPFARTGSGEMSALPRARGRAYPLVVGVVGAGRVGGVLGAALAAAGHHVVAAAAVSTASHERAARLLPAADILPADE